MAGVMAGIVGGDLTVRVTPQGAQEQSIMGFSVFLIPDSVTDNPGVIQYNQTLVVILNDLA
jgi:hypothetical protein